MTLWTSAGGTCALGSEPVLQLIPAAVCICDADGRIAFFNRRAVELWGREPRRHDDREKFCAACRVFDASGAELPAEATPMARAVREGLAFRELELTIERPDGSRFEASVNIDPLRDEAGGVCGAIHVFQDITAQKRRERHTALLARLNEALASATTEEEITRAATSLVGEHLGADRCGFFETDEARAEVIAPEGWQRGGLPSLAGTFRTAELVRPEAWERLAAGTMAVGDVAADPLTQPFQAAFAAMGIRAFVVCPCSAASPRGFALGLTAGEPRAWAEDEIALLEHVVGRVWPLIGRVRSEAARLRSEQWLRLATRTGKVGIWEWDVVRDEIAWTDSLHEIHGVAREEFAGTVAAFFALVHPDDRGPVQRAIQSALEFDVPYELEFRAVRPGGAIVWLFTSARVLREDGRAVRMLGTTLDVTARKAAELASRESEARFRALANHAPVGIFFTDTAGDCLFVNETWCEMAGMTPAEARGRGWVRALHPDDAEWVAREWYEAVQRHVPFVSEYRFVRRDGAVTWLQGSSAESRNASGAVVGHIGTIVDITERRAAEEALRQAQTELQTHAALLEHKVEERTASLRDAIAQMEEFSYSVSHDLRAPLRVMKEYAAVLLEDYGPQLDATARNHLERIRRSGLRMEKLTHDVLTYSRAARADVPLAAIDLGMLVRDIVGQYAELQPAAAKVEIVGPLGAGCGHEPALGQCFANLLTNAAKFVAPGVKPHIRVRAETRPGWVRIWVEDNGVGIAPEFHGRIFRIFERLPTAQAYEGTGIGLAIVRKAMEKMGGRCGVESDGVHGSRFWLELPAA